MIEFQVDFLPPRNNLNTHMSVRQRELQVRKAKEMLRPTLVNIIRNTPNLRIPFKRECGMEIIFSVNNKRRQDWDNLVTSFKPWQDMIELMGFVNDDSQIVDVRLLLRKGAAMPGVSVKLWEL